MKGLINTREDLNAYVNKTYSDDGVRASMLRLFDLSRGTKQAYLDEAKIIRKSLRNAGVLSLPFSLNRKRA